MDSRMFIEFESSPSGLNLLVESFARFAERERLPLGVRREMALALDEVVSNVIRHGHRGSAEHRITVIADLEGEVLSVEVIDDAPPFNILEVGPPPQRQPLHARPVGGVGIHLVKQLMDEIEYRRDGELNRLVLRKRIEEET